MSRVACLSSLMTCRWSTATMIFLVFLLCQTLLTRADNTIWGENFTHGSWQASAVNAAGTRLYIDGGEYYTGKNDVLNYLTTTMAIDLTSSWSSCSISPSQRIQAQKPEDFVLVRQPVTWYSSAFNKLFSWGGWAYNGTQNQLWSVLACGSYLLRLDLPSCSEYDHKLWIPHVVFI